MLNKELQLAECIIMTCELQYKYLLAAMLTCKSTSLISFADILTYFLAAIGNAFAVLTDPVKRKRYDQFGSEEERVEVAHSNHRNKGYHFDYTRGFEGRNKEM